MNTDSVKISVPVLRKIMTAAEEAKVLKEQKRLLEERISVLQQTILTMEEKEGEKTAAYDTQLKNLLDQNTVYDDQIKAYERLLRKERRKRFWTRAIGMATTVTAFYIGLK